MPNKPAPKKTPPPKPAKKTPAKVVSPQPFDGSFTPDALDLLRRTICKDAPDDDFYFFVTVCERTRLDPFARQIYLIERRQKVGDVWVSKWTAQTSIDGFRLIAARTGEYQGQTETLWCGEDGVWRDAWLLPTPPTSCKLGVRRAGFPEPLVAVARFAAYAGYANNCLTVMWRTKGDVMIAKCAEAAALRRAFPQELGGIYVQEEMEETGEQPELDTTARLESLGATVETSKPAETKKPDVSLATPAKEPTWRDYKIQGFDAQSRFFNRTLGELHKKELAWLRDKWTGARNVHAAEIQKMVLVALAELGEGENTVAKEPSKPQEAAKPEKGADTAKTGEKPATGQPEGRKGASKEPSKAGWRDWTVDIPRSRATHGKKLGEIADAKKGEITFDGNPKNDKDAAALKMCAACDGREWIRTLHRQGIAASGDNHAQIDAIKAAAKELAVFDDPDWLKALDEKLLRAEVLRRFAEHGMDDAKATVAINDITSGTPIAKLEEKMLRYILEQWEKVEKLIEGDKLP